VGQLRIIAGSLGGRRIAAPTIPGVRPTSEKVREALFAILGPRVAGASVLDAFAGSGAIGCEALSRGALRVVFVELDRRVARVLLRNLAALGVGDRSQVLIEDATNPQATIAASGPFDLIVADPPYGSGLAGSFVARVAEDRMLAPDGLVVLETGVRDVEPAGSGSLRRVRSERYGDTRLDFLRAS
jgi:16S rRNA (guanine(966)-N(2))-methyltransferase RsmD